MTNNECMLTTIDNPYDPFEEFTLWMLFDNEKGYNSSGRLMRIANITDEMSQVEINQEVERAIDEIIFYDPLNIYKKVRRKEKTQTNT